MNPLLKEIEQEMLRPRLDKGRLYTLLSKIVENCSGGGAAPAAPAKKVAPAPVAAPAPVPAPTKKADPAPTPAPAKKADPAPVKKAAPEPAKKVAPKKKAPTTA
jgi:hypothetical protein